MHGPMCENALVRVMLLAAASASRKLGTPLNVAGGPSRNISTVRLLLVRRLLLLVQVAAAAAAVSSALSRGD